MKNQIEELETTLSFFEDTLEKIGIQITAQQQEIVNLKAKVKNLDSKLDNITKSNISNNDQPPPHY